MPAFLHGFQCVWDQVWLSMGSAHQSRNDYQYFKLINLWEYLNPFTVLQSPSLLSRRKNSNHFTFQASSNNVTFLSESKAWNLFDTRLRGGSRFCRWHQSIIRIICHFAIFPIWPITRITRPAAVRRSRFKPNQDLPKATNCEDGVSL